MEETASELYETEKEPEDDDEELPYAVTSHYGEWARLLRAANVQRSFRQKTLQFMRTAALHGDLTQFCGVEYTRTKAELNHFCGQNTCLR